MIRNSWLGGLRLLSAVRELRASVVGGGMVRLSGDGSAEVLRPTAGLQEVN
jgi:hypothetical protein